MEHLHTPRETDYDNCSLVRDEEDTTVHAKGPTEGITYKTKNPTRKKILGPPEHFFLARRNAKERLHQWRNTLLHLVNST